MSSFDKRALVFAHYHRAGLLRSDTIELLNYVGKTFFDKIVVVSTHLTDKEKSKISDFCEVIVRENIGYDFFLIVWASKQFSLNYRMPKSH